MFIIAVNPLWFTHYLKYKNMQSNRKDLGNEDKIHTPIFARQMHVTMVFKKPNLCRDARKITK